MINVLIGMFGGVLSVIREIYNDIQALLESNLDDRRRLIIHAVARGQGLIALSLFKTVMFLAIAW